MEKIILGFLLIFLIFNKMKKLKMKSNNHIIDYSYYSESSLNKDIIYSRLYDLYCQFFSSYFNIFDITIDERIKELARWGVAQSMLETASYKRILLIEKIDNKEIKVKTKNLFNIKYGYSEFYNFYRVYENYCSSVIDYVRLLTSKKYVNHLINYIMTGNYEYLKEVCKIYAEDKFYFEKVYNIFKNLDLNYYVNYDKNCSFKIIEIPDLL